MSELTTEQIIKLIVGAVVIVVVLAGVYFIFKDKIFEFFNTLPTNTTLGNFWRILYD